MYYTKNYATAGVMFKVACHGHMAQKKKISATICFIVYQNVLIKINDQSICSFTPYSSTHFKVERQIIS